ncbi:MAG: CDP-alcohol phosphatidyltransferase family protein [Chloroflexi bacterium]|nr:CDP-alcohol phosphatidyltransferase family protein [Chloroflexota bacterium]
MIRLSAIRKTIASYLTQPVVKLLARTPLAPDAITWLGFLITLGATALIISQHLFTAGLVVLIAGFFDILDGALARRTNRATRFGSVLDSTLDRLAEAALLLGLLVLYARGGLTVETLLAGLALPGSLMVSYIRAKAESLGMECQVGLFTRAERVVVLALGLLLSRINDGFLIIALAIIVVFSFITVGQRLFNVWQQTRKTGNS